MSTKASHIRNEAEHATQANGLMIRASRDAVQGNATGAGILCCLGLAAAWATPWLGALFLAFGLLWASLTYRIHRRPIAFIGDAGIRFRGKLIPWEMIESVYSASMPRYRGMELPSICLRLRERKKPALPTRLLRRYYRLFDHGDINIPMQTASVSSREVLRHIARHRPGLLRDEDAAASAEPEPVADVGRDDDTPVHEPRR